MPEAECEKSRPGRIVILTGSPGTGKTTVASILAQISDFSGSVHMHTDDFYHYLSKGAVPPHLPEANEQNRVVIEALLEAAKRFARGGYEVIVDGIVGPWFLEPWQKAAEAGYEIHYLILRASREETLARALGRSKLTREENLELVETMWHQFQTLGPFEANVVSAGDCTAEEAAARVQAKLREGSCRL